MSFHKKETEKNLVSGQTCCAAGARGFLVGAMVEAGEGGLLAGLTPPKVVNRTKIKDREISGVV